MPKNVFWPATLVVMGLIFLASNLGMLPAEFWNFWPLVLIIVGLGGLLTSDREEWLVNVKPQKKSRRKRRQANSKKTKRSKRQKT